MRLRAPFVPRWGTFLSLGPVLCGVTSLQREEPALIPVSMTSPSSPSSPLSLDAILLISIISRPLMGDSPPAMLVTRLLVSDSLLTTRFSPDFTDKGRFSFSVLLGGILWIWAVGWPGSGKQGQEQQMTQPTPQAGGGTAGSTWAVWDTLATWVLLVSLAV